MDSESRMDEEININDGSLSPVLCDNKTNLKFIKAKKMQRKSRIKLVNRFNPPTSQTKIEETTFSSETTEEIFTPSQTDTILKTIEILENLESESPVKKPQKFDSFDFKKPVSPLVPNKHSGFQGFQTATGKNINLSEEKVQKTKKLFDDIFNPCETSLSRSNKQSFLAKKKANNSDSQDFSGNRSIGNNKSETINILNQNTGGFQKATGKEIKIAESALKRANLLFNEDFMKESENVTDDHNKIIKCEMGFKTASGNETKVTNSALEKAENFFGEDFKNIISNEAGNNILSTNKRPLFNDSSCGPLAKKMKIQGFSTASTNPVNKPQSALNEIDANNENCISFDKKVGNKIHKPVCGFQTGSGSSVKLSEKSLKLAQNLFENMDKDIENLMNQSLEKANLDESGEIVNKPKKHLGVSRGKSKINISQEQLDKARLIFDDEKSISLLSPIRISKTPQSSVYNSTPLKDMKDISIESDLTPIKKISIDNNQSQIKNTSLGIGDGKIILQEPTKENVDFRRENLEAERKRLELNLQMTVKRLEILAMQQALINNSSEGHRRKRVGILLNKKQNSPRISLKYYKSDFFSSESTNITPQKAELVHFNYSGELIPCVETEDGACVIPNTKNLIGLAEIETAFKVMPGIEPKLIPDGWIKNHFKWIVWKLSSYEKVFSDCLNVENVIQQLKYRYDREIDRAERPALRKIFERDDVPQKRMVLCVSNIFNLKNNNVELELTDGWYSIRTIIDEPLCCQVYKQKLRIGTKLVISGAQLLNCDGCHPLDANDKVRLKIVCNSTRRAVWWAKLGYQKQAEPFPLTLRSLYPAGGSVGCIKVYVARVYPVKYLEKQNNLSVWRNKKAEEKRAQDWENERQKKLQEIQEIVRNDYEKSMQKESISKISNSDIKNISCPQTLYNLYQNSKDPESFQEMLTQSQKNAIVDYQQQLSFRRQQEIRTKMQESLSKLPLPQRNVTQVLQLLLIDVLDNEEKTCYFQIWHPSETHIQILKEATFFHIYNVIPKKNGDLMSIKTTKFDPIKEDSTKYRKYDRTLLPIAEICSLGCEPVFKEFDTVGIIVQISIDFDQSFWLADCCEKLLYVKVFENPKNCSLLDNFKCGQLVSVSNLKFCKPNFVFGEAIANHSTIISSYPQHKHLQKGMEDFNSQFPKDMKDFLEKCTQKLAYYIDKISVSKNTTKSSINSLIQSTSSVFDIFDDSAEESTLIYSRITKTDEALSMLDLDKLT